MARTLPLTEPLLTTFVDCRALADVLYIYPLKKDKKTFDANKEELGFASKARVQRKATVQYIPIGRLTEEQKIALAQDEMQLKSK